MVLRSMPSPAWLDADAPHGEIVISSRVRYARNLVGYRFPHHSIPEELRTVLKECRTASTKAGLPLVMQDKLTEAERDFLLGSRLISPEFNHRDPGRAILLDEARTVSVMINEEDHLRLQALTAGWSVKTAQVAVDHVLNAMQEHLTFMRTPELGYLTASPTNLGKGRRRSALFHLIGLAHTKRLMSVLQALAAWGLTARGLFGESSRAVGAFFQVSATTATLPEFIGATEYLLGEERQARREVTRLELQDRTEQAVEFAISSAEISLADALRVLGWVRWASTVGIPLMPPSYRDVDAVISTMEVHGTQNANVAARHRASFLRARLEAHR